MEREAVEIVNWYFKDSLLSGDVLLPYLDRPEYKFIQIKPREIKWNKSAKETSRIVTSVNNKRYFISSDKADKHFQAKDKEGYKYGFYAIHYFIQQNPNETAEPKFKPDSITKQEAIL